MSFRIGLYVGVRIGVRVGYSAWSRVEVQMFVGVRYRPQTNCHSSMCHANTSSLER